MLSSVIVTAAALFLLPFLHSAAELGSETNPYTVWASVIYSRTGDRTPAILGTLPTQLTSLGAQQQYAVGQYLRNRYLTAATYNGVGSARIPGLSPDTLDVTQMSISAWELQFAVASAQAFLQGFYPPFELVSNSTDVQDLLDPSSVVVNSTGATFVPSPLNGYQYPLIQSYGFNDPDVVYMAGMYECPAFDVAVLDYLEEPSTYQTAIETFDFYSAVGKGILDDVLSADEWNFDNAYAIYDYINYQTAHNATVFNIADSGESLDRLRWYADQAQFSWLGNAYATNNLTSSPWPSKTGSISTIAGNFLASQMLGLLQQAITDQAQYNKINLLFGDFQPLVSLFSLLDLPPFDSNFYGLPSFASVAIFELFSHANDTSTFPSEDELWIRFYFANGTANDTNFQAYPMFNLGPDSFDMPWTQWQTSMYDLVAGDVGDWCNQCGAMNIFCAYYNTSDSLDASAASSSGSRHAVSPAVGGVIGAIVALVVAGILFAALMLLGGIRLHRVERRSSDLGGYKGSQKLASDKDLVLPKGGAVVGAAVETSPEDMNGVGHERVGSWEMKKSEVGMTPPRVDVPEAVARRPSYEDDEEGDGGLGLWRRPTEPDERV